MENIILQINNDYFVVLDDEYNKALRNFTIEGNTDWIKVTEWIEKYGVLLMGEHYFILNKEEVESLTKEFSHSFISKENPLCEKLLNKMMIFVKEK